jgi:serine/threonine-protein kinase
LFQTSYHDDLPSGAGTHACRQPLTLVTHEDSALPEDHAATSSSSRSRPPRLLADRYDVIDVVGTGASAVTWRGHDRRLDRQVAIKILRRDGEQDAAYTQRFEREARTSASVSNGNVVNVYDVGQQDGWLYLVMQFIDGEDLKHAIARRGALPATEAREITRQILHGLAAIHRAGILHRDIKPQNVLIDGDGIARVTDFGIAQSSVDIGLTTAGTTVGTAAYMAPEQAQAGPLSEATDIYAVGVVLYEMLTGVLPFEKPTAMATMLAHIQEEPRPPSVRMPQLHIPPLLDGIVMQAMAKDPASRFRSAAAMSRALDGNLNDPGATTHLATPAPVARPQDRTRVAPSARDQAWPAASRPPAAPTSRPPTSAAARGSSGRGLLNAVLVLILLAMTVVAAYMYYEYTQDNSGNDDPTPTPAATVEQVAPTQREEPTEEPVIAPVPTDEPLSTATTEPDVEPTDIPIEPADPTEQVIEPEDGSPIGDG